MWQAQNMQKKSWINGETALISNYQLGLHLLSDRVELNYFPVKTVFILKRGYQKEEKYRSLCDTGWLFMINQWKLENYHIWTVLFSQQVIISLFYLAV